MPNIVTVNVTQTQAPIPNTLQRTGAMISQGATTTAPNTLTLITQPSDLTAIAVAPKAITNITWASSVATVSTAVPHGITIGDTLLVTIAGAVPVGYNQVSVAATSTGASTFTYPLSSNPGTETTPGTWVPRAVNELTSMVTTFYAQGASVAVYVLELGLGSVTAGVTALTAWLIANPLVVYRILVPRGWDNNSGFLVLLQSYQSPTAKLYFHVTTTVGTYANYPVLDKDVFAMVEAPGTPVATEFSSAAPFYWALNINPSSTNKVAPFSFTFLFGVTPWAASGTQTQLTAFKTAGVNYVGTGAEGGITTAVLFWGTTMDVRPFNYWYSVDWTQINVDLNIANAVINGSNNPINPLYLNQDGINRLQAVGAATLSSGVTFGMILGTVVQSELNGVDFGAALAAGTFAGQAVINAVPFVAYFTASPSDYRTGTYNGFSVTMTPLRGFESITFNINVTDFVAQ